MGLQTSAIRVETVLLASTTNKNASKSLFSNNSIPMLLVAGLTPAWQQIAVLDRLRVGEVNRAGEVQWCASGKVLNVGLALMQLGAAAKTVSMIGSGSAGEAMRREMAALNVDVGWVESSASQRVCTTLLDRVSGQTTEIVENSPPTTLNERQSFVALFADAANVTELKWVVLTGSLPQGTPHDFYSKLLSYVHAPAILDVRGAELLAALPHHPLVVKPNREELGLTVGRTLQTDTDVWQAMAELQELGAQWVIVTDGPNEVLVSSATRDQPGRWRFQPPHVDLVNPIGCGDCFTAGLADALQRGDDMLDAIRFGIAAAAYNATQLLPARLDRQKVASLAGQVLVESTT